MKFILVDQLLALDTGKSIRTAKSVSMAEEYLADHFPGFPVLPGVMMLESAVQTAAWLVRQSLGFAHSLIVLQSAKRVVYGTFVAPGNTLIMQADAVEISAGHSDFKIKGTVNGATAITARLELAHLNLADTDPQLATIDRLSLDAQRLRWDILLQHSATLAIAAPLNTTAVPASIH